MTNSDTVGNQQILLYNIVEEEVVNLLVPQIIIKNKSNFNIIFRFNFKADSVSPSGLFNTDIEL